jgi:hypothetical protein
MDDMRVRNFVTGKHEKEQIVFNVHGTEKTWDEKIVALTGERRTLHNEQLPNLCFIRHITGQ